MLLAVPSCVPALPGFEDAGASITPDDIREALGWEGVAGLGEMMNMPGVIESDAGDPRDDRRDARRAACR